MAGRKAKKAFHRRPGRLFVQVRLAGPTLPPSARVVYNTWFPHNLWSDKRMIRFLQTEGPFKKIVLSGLLLLICAAMAITLIPGGLGNELTGTPGKGIVAKVSGEDITVEQVREAARNMAQQQAQRQAAQFGVNPSTLVPFL